MSADYNHAKQALRDFNNLSFWREWKCVELPGNHLLNKILGYKETVKNILQSSADTPESVFKDKEEKSCGINFFSEEIQHKINAIEGEISCEIN